MEKPILFSTEMVKAIQESRKTQTRRLIKPQPTGPFVIYKCLWQSGDILWVRETWCKNPYGTGAPYCYKADEESWIYDDMEGMWKPSIHMPRKAARLFLKVKDIRVERLQDISHEDAIKEGITFDMAMTCNNWSPTFTDPDSGGDPDYVEAFKVLWDSINAKRGYGWDVNPWVWVVEFERMNPA